jgi:hypothetical protein
LISCSAIRNLVNPNEPDTTPLPPIKPSSPDGLDDSTSTDDPFDIPTETDGPNLGEGPNLDHDIPLKVEAPLADGALGLAAEEIAGNKVKILVTYNCPFPKGQLRLAFLTTTGDPIRKRIDFRKDVSYVNKGQGTSEFQAEGDDVYSYWLVARLNNRDLSGCGRTLPWRPPKLQTGLKPGEYRDRNCAIWRLVEFPLQWRDPKGKPNRGNTALIG